MARFLKEYDAGQFNGWWEIEDGKLYNIFGGCHAYEPSPDDIIAEADEYEELDWSELLNPDSRYGFIDPDGNWYGCDFTNHILVAKLVLKVQDEDELTDIMGWVKVFRSSDGSAEYYSRRRFLTEAQIRCLEEHGIEVREHHREVFIHEME